MKIQVILDLDIADDGNAYAAELVAKHIRSTVGNSMGFDFGLLGTFTAIIERAEIATSPGFFDAATAAVRTLESKGYTYHGGEQWKPPLGKMPDYLAEPTSPSELAAASEVPSQALKSPESPPAHPQGLSDCPYSVGDVLRYDATEGQLDWTVSEIVGDRVEIIPASGAWALREYHSWRELEASPEWEIYKKAGDA